MRFHIVTLIDTASCRCVAPGLNKIQMDDLGTKVPKTVYVYVLQFTAHKKFR